MGASERAAALAASLRKDLGIQERHMDLFALVKEAGIEIRLGRIPGGAEGLSVSLGNKDVILLDPACKPETRQRFTLAHEFGHHLLGHANACTSDMIHGPATEPLEKEANSFATALLMPAKLFRQDIRPIHPCFEEISPLAGQYGVSLTAAAIRYVDQTDDCCALLCFRPDQLAWLVKSRGAQAWWFHRDPPTGSLVADCLRGSDAEDTQHVPASIWLENHGGRARHQIREQVRSVAENSCLVLLSELPDPDDDPDLVDREAQEDLERRRKSFRRY